MKNNEILDTNRPEIILFTIGHSHHDINHFIGLLKNNNISCLVDVRSVPYGKYNRNFEKGNLYSELLRNGIEYIWMGETLGGRRNDLKSSIGFRQDDRYDSDPKYNTGMLELVGKALIKPTAIMCSEEDPRKCHRHKIIAYTLLHKKIPELYKFERIKLTHIRASGKLEDASLIETYFQLSLFE